MKKQIALLALACAALVAVPAALYAQDSSGGQPAAKSAKVAKKNNANRPLPFRGKVTAVDTTAKTVTVGNRVFNVTSDTKIETNGQTGGALSDIKVGDQITGSSTKDAGGKLTATLIRSGAKDASAGKASAGGKKKKSGTSQN